MDTVRVLVVEDMPHVRHDLCALLALAGGIQVVGEAGDGEEAMWQAMRLTPDVVLMDLEMPVLDGYAATHRIKAQHPTCRVVAFSVHDYALAREKALAAGADEFVVKGAPLEVLLQAIRQRDE